MDRVEVERRAQRVGAGFLLPVQRPAQGPIVQFRRQRPAQPRALARRQYSAAVLAATPQARAAVRSGSPSPICSRRISRIMCAANLSCAIGVSFRVKGDHRGGLTCAVKRSSKTSVRHAPARRQTRECFWGEGGDQRRSSALATSRYLRDASMSRLRGLGFRRLKRCEILVHRVLQVILCPDFSVRSAGPVLLEIHKPFADIRVPSHQE